jgi:hypothetical protein
MGYGDNVMSDGQGGYKVVGDISDAADYNEQVTADTINQTKAAQSAYGVYQDAGGTVTSVTDFEDVQNMWNDTETGGRALLESAGVTQADMDTATTQASTNTPSWGDYAWAALLDMGHFLSTGEMSSTNFASVVTQE